MTLTERGGRKLLFIGWDAADWQIINPLIEAGKMPTLAKLISEGVSGNLATMTPVLSPMLWTSIATGKRPHKHGICGFIEPSPQADGIRPVTSTSRTTRAIWNILSYAGWHVNLINWYASHPAEPINGNVVTNLVTRPTRDPEASWQMPPNGVHPQESQDLIQDLRVGSGDITMEQIAPFIPKLGGTTISDPEIAEKLSAIRHVLATTATSQSIATGLLELTKWDATFVYFDAIDHFGHHFMEFRPPRMEGVDPKLVEAFGDTIESMYQFHDLMLARQLHFCDEQTTIVICSDHGFLNGTDRPRQTLKQMTGPAQWHRHFGMVVMKGPGIAQGKKLFGASVLDLTPTLLALLGMPVGQDMDGRILHGVFEKPPRSGPTNDETIPSWDSVEGDFGEHSAEVRVDPIEAAEAVKQLVELGYVDAQNTNIDEQVELAKKELKFNLIQSLLDAHRPDRAAPLAAELADRYPNDQRFLAVHARMLIYRNQVTQAETVINHLSHLMANSAPVPAGEPVQIVMLRASVAEARKDYDSALRLYQSALAMQPDSVNLHLSVANALLRSRQFQDAERILNDSLKLDAEQPQALLGLARLAFRRRDFGRTSELCLASIEAQTFNYEAHALLGQALAHLGQVDDAINACQFALRIHPLNYSVHRLLAVLYSRMNAEPMAEMHRTRSEQIIAYKRQKIEAHHLLEKEAQ